MSCVSDIASAHGQNECVRGEECAMRAVVRHKECGECVDTIGMCVKGCVDERVW